MVDREAVARALREVHDPELHRSIVDLGMVQGIDIEGGRVRVRIALTTGGCPLKETIAAAVRRRVEEVPGVERVEVEMGEMTPEQRRQLFGQQLASPLLAEDAPTRIVAVASGKGGVGKSTVTVNLAVALRREGFDVGVLDCDIYGFSVPRMVGVSGTRPTVIDGKMIPVPAYGLKVMSMGFFVAENQPVVWRGPMLGKILRQFLSDVVWGPLDFLLLDLPPGTGDMALDVAQLIPKSHLLLVTTPEPVAASVASRAAEMARKTNQKIIGVIENMSYFVCPDCGAKAAVFGEEGGRQLAEALGVPLLARIPLTMEARQYGDRGVPVASVPGSAVGEAFREAALSVARALGVASAGAR